MSDDTAETEPDGTEATNQTTDDEPEFTAVRYEDGSVSYPGHPLGPGGAEPVETVDLAERVGEVVTWTTSTATPPGVREPNTLAIVEFDVDGEPVRALGQATSDDLEIGDAVEPVYCERLRDPEQSLREPASQPWDGFRFRPVED
ncbi:MAG: OB-fold domain-containing protein [Halolamina sp.]